jgi:hypothetical protein
MVQLADLANFFESIRNFYEWRKPTRTLAVLVVLLSLIITCTFVPTRLLIKASTLSFAFTFFGLFPLAVHYPEYRLLLSPTKRLFWNIPTHAEWAIKYIQAEGTRVAADTGVPSDPPAIPLKTTPEAARVHDYGFYTAHHDKAKGHLVISAASCRFVSNVGHDTHFNVAYDQIQRLEKRDRVVAKKMPKQLTRDSGKDLKIVTKAGREWVLSDMQQRDEAFSQIVGFSRTVWQVVW